MTTIMQDVDGMGVIVVARLTSQCNIIGVAIVRAWTAHSKKLVTNASALQRELAVLPHMLEMDFAMMTTIMQDVDGMVVIVVARLTSQCNIIGVAIVRAWTAHS